MDAREVMLGLEPVHELWGIFLRLHDCSMKELILPDLLLQRPWASVCARLCCSTERFRDLNPCIHSLLSLRGNNIFIVCVYLSSVTSSWRQRVWRWRRRGTRSGQTWCYLSVFLLVFPSACFHFLFFFLAVFPAITPLWSHSVLHHLQCLTGLWLCCCKVGVASTL